MRTRIPGSMRTRQSLSDLIEGHLSTPDGRSELVKLATRLIVEEGLEAESREAVGRDYYAHGAAAGQGYRNGTRPGRLKYAHQYYGPVGQEAGGLQFPGATDEPDYWDFVYFALVIGMSAQVSDVAVSGRRIRRTVMVHAIVAFWFNVAVLALLINIAADAIRS